MLLEWPMIHYKLSLIIGVVFNYWSGQVTTLSVGYCDLKCLDLSHMTRQCGGQFVTAY